MAIIYRLRAVYRLARFVIGNAFNAGQIRTIVADAAKKAGIHGLVSPHWLRHSHASHSLDWGAPPQLVQQTLGHSSLDTLIRYAHLIASKSIGSE